MLPPSFETLASQAPQDEVRILRKLESGRSEASAIGRKAAAPSRRSKQSEKGNSASPTDAHNLAVEQLALLPDGRSRCRAA